MANNAEHHTHARRLRLGRGFTLVELLVVIFIIVLLISILVVGLNAAIRVAREQVDRATARNLGVAATSFENSFGFAPPLVHDGAFDADIRGSMGTSEGPVVRRGDGTLGTDAVVRIPVPGVTGVSRYFTPAYVPALNRQFLRGSEEDENVFVQGRYDFMAGASTDTIPRRNSEWTAANQRYSKHTITYMLLGAGPAMIDGVEGEGMVAPDRSGVFPDAQASTFDPLVAASTAGLETSVTTADRFPPFFSPSEATPVVQSYADETEWFENGATEAQANQIPALVENGELAFSIALTDSTGKAYRFYRWTTDENPQSTAALNIPSALIDPQLLLEFTDAAGQDERRRIDLTDGDAELRGARWAIVGAGPNGVFGTETVAELLRGLGRLVPQDPKVLNMIAADTDAVLELRREAWADNAVELGR